jgi:hypothetical protein
MGTRRRCPAAVHGVLPCSCRSTCQTSSTDVDVVVVGIIGMVPLLGRAGVAALLLLTRHGAAVSSRLVWGHVALVA